MTKPRLTWMLACAGMTCFSIADLSAAELAPTGVLRATYNSRNLADARFDNKTNMIVGPIADLTKGIARRLEVPFEIAGVEGPARVVDRVKTRGADIGFVPCEQATARDVDVSKPFTTIGGGKQCIIVGKGGRTGLAFVDQFIDDMRESGRLDDIMKR